MSDNDDDDIMVNVSCLDSEHRLFLFERQIPDVDRTIQLGDVEHSRSALTPASWRQVAHVVPRSHILFIYLHAYLFNID